MIDLEYCRTVAMRAQNTYEFGWPGATVCMSVEEEAARVFLALFTPEFVLSLIEEVKA